MFFGKKFNQLSYRLWGLLFILMGNTKLMSFQTPNINQSYLISILNPFMNKWYLVGGYVPFWKAFDRGDATEKDLYFRRMYTIFYL